MGLLSRAVILYVYYTLRRLKTTVVDVIASENYLRKLYDLQMMPKMSVLCLKPHPAVNISVAVAACSMCGIWQPCFAD